MGNTEYFATARVKLKPDASTFREQLKADVNSAIKRAGVFKIPVKLELQAFRRQLKREIGRAAFDVPVRPDVTGFRTKLREQLAGLEIPVKVTPVGVTQAAAARQAAGVSAAAAAAGAAGPAAAAAAAKLSEEERILRDVQRARQGTQAALIASERAYATALGSVTTADERAVALESARKTSAAGLAQASAAELSAEVRRKAALDAGNEAEARRQATIQEGLATDRQALAAQLERIETTQLADRTEARHAALKIASADATSTAAAATGVETASLRKVAEVRAVNNAQLQAERALEAAVAEAKEIRIAAERLGNTVMAQEAAELEATNAALLQQVQAERALTVERLRGLGPLNERIRQDRQLAKGALAASLGTLGLRGAVLAASGPFLVGTAAAIGFVKAVGSAANLEQQLNVFRVTAEATADEMERVRAQAVALGADITLPAVNAGDAATAMTELSKAGLSVENSIAAARGTLQLATAGEIDQAQAANLVASALNAFGKSGTEAIHVADLLANASKEAQGGITEMGEALENSAAVARIAGVGIDELVAFITEMARAGRQGGEAGTTLRNAMLRLLNPADKARAVLEKLRLESGASVRVLDSAGRLNINIFRQIQEATDRLGAAERRRALGTIFTTRSIVAQGILGRVTAQELQEEIEAVNRAGAAQELAGAQTAGFNGKLEALKNSLATLGVNLGNVTLGPLGGFIEGLSELISTANEGIGVLGDLNRTLDDLGLGFLGEGIGTGIRESLKTAASGGLIPRLAIAGLRDLFEPVEVSAESARQEVALLILELQKAQNVPFGQGAPIVGLNETVVGLQKIVTELEKGSPAAQQLARDIQGVIEQLQAGASVPDIRIPVALEIPRQQLFEGLEQQTEELKKRFISLSDLGVAGLGRMGASVRDLDGNLEDAVLGVEKIVRALPAERGTAESFERSADAIQKLAAGLDRSNPSAASLREKLLDMVSALRAAALTAPKAGEDIGKGVVKGIDDSFRAAFPDLVDTTNELLTNLANATKPTAETAGEDIGAALTTGLDTALAIAEARGDEAGRLALLRTRRERQQRRLAALLVGAGLPPSATAEDVRAATEAGRISREQGNKIRNAADALKKTDDEITGILDDRAQARERAARDAETAKNKIIQANNKHDQAVIDSFARAETRLTLNKAKIEASKKLSDDLDLSNALIKLYQSEIREAKKRIRDAKTANEVILDLTRQLNDERARRADLIRQQNEAAREKRRAALEREQESLELDVQIAETTGNKAALARALKAEIDFYRGRIKATRAGSLERKRWILALRQAQKELKDLRDEQKKVKEEFRAMAFEFLTTQQGFAATLLGNLLPAQALSGTVGGTSSASTGLRGTAPSPSSATAAGISGIAAQHFIQERMAGAAAKLPTNALQDQAARAAVQERGSSHAQASRMITLMVQMVHQLMLLNRRAGHPEARRSERASSAFMDTE